MVSSSENAEPNTRSSGIATSPHTQLHGKHHPDFAHCLKKLKYETYRFSVFKAIVMKDFLELKRLLQEEGKDLDRKVVLNRVCTYICHSWIRRNESISRIFEMFQPFLLHLRDLHYQLAYSWGELYMALGGASTIQGPPLEHIRRSGRRMSLHAALRASRGRFGAPQTTGIFHMNKLKCQPKMTALPIAIALDQYQACHLLLENGAEVSLYEVVFAIRNSRFEIFLLLISFWDARDPTFQCIPWKSDAASTESPNPTKPGIQRHTQRSSQRDVKISNKVIKLLTHVKYLDRHIIDYAVQWHRKDIVDFILNLTDMDIYSSRYYRVLESIFTRSSEFIVRAILNRFPHMAHRFLPGCPEKNTPLHLAALHFRDDLVKILIEEYHVDVNSLNMHKQQPLHLCCYRLARDLGLSRKWIWGTTSGILAAKALIHHGADLNRHDGFSHAPLHIILSRPFYGGAITQYHEELVSYMIDCGADIHDTSDIWDDDAPLHFCSRTGQQGLARILLSHGASLTQKNKDGNVPEDVAKDEEMRLFFINETMESSFCRVSSLRRLALLQVLRSGPVPEFYRKRNF